MALLPAFASEVEAAVALSDAAVAEEDALASRLVTLVSMPWTVVSTLPTADTPSGTRTCTVGLVTLTTRPDW